MDVELNVLIIDPVLGTSGLMELAGRLRAAVEVAETGDVHGSMPCVLSAAVTARLQRDPRVWDWVISGSRWRRRGGADGLARPSEIRRADGPTRGASGASGGPGSSESRLPSLRRLTSGRYLKRCR